MSIFKLDSKSMEDYLLKNKSYVDELVVVGAPVPHEEHVDVILEGILYDYAHVVSIIESKKHISLIIEVEALLYGHGTQTLVSP